MTSSEDVRFDGTVALVTGAGRGMGRAHALLLASRGAKLVVNDLGVTPSGEEPSAAAVEEVVAEIRSAGGEAIADPNSVASREDARAMVAAAVSAFGQLDVVVNNAGLPERFGMEWTDEPAQDLDRQLAVHVRGTYLVSQAAWPHLMSSQGRVVNIASNRGLFGGPTGQSYNAAKGGVVGLTRGLALAGIKAGIRVNAVLPLAMTRMVASGIATPLGQRMAAVNPTPEQVSQIVAYLAHESCALNGEIFTAGMGRYARVFIAVTEGIFDSEATPETIRDRIDEIREEEGYMVPRSGGEEMAIFFDRWEATVGSGA
jgi:NAD(P)-dependent dehydrogenase (short-subunit alcohol dehydrogenase family)